VKKDSNAKNVLRLCTCGMGDKRGEHGVLLRYEAIEIASRLANECMERIGHLDAYKILAETFDREKVRVFF